MDLVTAFEPDLLDGPARGSGDKRSHQKPGWLTPAGVDGVCGWLADGHHYHKTFGGKPGPACRLRAMSRPTASSS